MSGMRALAMVCGALIAGGAALRLGADLLTLVQHLSGLLFTLEPAWLAQAVSILFVSGALLSLPLQVRLAADSSDAGRPWLFAGPGAVIAAALVLTAGAVPILYGGENLLEALARHLSMNLGGMVEALPVMLLLLGLLAMAGRAGPAAGALLAAPLIMLTVLSLILNVSIAGSTLTASLPMLLCAGALLPAVIHGRRPALAVWPAAAVAIAGFAVVLISGLLTASELTAILLVPGIAAGIVGYLGAPPPVRGVWLERAATDLGGLILALMALNLVTVLLSSISPIVEVKRELSGVMPAAMLGLTFIGYVIVASFATPLVSVALILIMISAAYGAGVPADVLVVGLTVAALQISVTRGVAREGTPLPGSVVLPPSQASWAQMLIMIVFTLIGVASILGWV
ncbi:MAG: hypothetical protein JO055_01885 [Alphaproteobacteria bacterium]|nr:hypothetical protein [Alphaproteobacteria bacterium]